MRTPFLGRETVPPREFSPTAGVAFVGVETIDHPASADALEVIGEPRFKFDHVSVRINNRVIKPGTNGG
jgi:hypothetical protein